MIGDVKIRVIRYNTIIVGTGTAGFNAAERLFTLGQKDIAMVTENINSGISRNTGSDKQTYYKLTLSGCEPDSVMEMAQTLFQGKCVDGDIALCEAALSVQCFLHLCELGVAFPRNRYGEFVGYKTDHDPRRRATSVGPYTSKMMTEALERSIIQKGIKIHDNCQVIKILTSGGSVSGLLCLDESNNYTLFSCSNVIYATGVPAGVYSESVYPLGHYGASGIAFEAGVRGKNLTEWQFGLASLHPRWNVSGTYMQVLPKFVSTDKDGGSPREFLLDFFSNQSEMLSKIFLKGYQWPFDVSKVNSGSSIIDILVYIEGEKGRRVFLDFRENPAGMEPDYSGLSPEAREYLSRAGACFGKPIDRLLHTNAPAVDFYMDKGVDIRTEMLEIALCAQHNNGGLSIDCWWKTNIDGFFACGEVAGSHGVYRPGGSALNAGQVGSLRAAQFIAARRGNCDELPIDESQIYSTLALIQTRGEANNADVLLGQFASWMSKAGGAIRNGHEIETLKIKAERLISNFCHEVKVSSKEGLKKAYRLYDVLICQYVYLSAMEEYAKTGGKSRGSALYSDQRGVKPHGGLPDKFTFSLSESDEDIQEVEYIRGKCVFYHRKPRPIPEDDDFFENVWRGYRKDENIY